MHPGPIKIQYLTCHYSFSLFVCADETECSLTKELRTRAKSLVQSGIKASTARTYGASQLRYVRFCELVNIKPLPCTEDNILMYIAYLDKSGLKASSVKVYIAALRSYSIDNGFGNPFEMFYRVNKAIRAMEIKSTGPRQKLPITFEIMSKMHQFFHQEYNDFVIWAAMCVGFFGCLRAAEYTVVEHQSYDPTVNVAMNDFTLQNGQYISIKIKRSKTDHLNQGFSVYIAATTKPVCGMSAVLNMLTHRRALGLPCLPESPLFLLSNGQALSRTMLIYHTKVTLARLGYDSSMYSGHSFRAGSATTAAINGLPEWQIKLLGRWKSNCYQMYIRTPVTTVLEFSSKLAL